MNIETVIQQLRTVATVFGGNVAGAAQYANAIADQVWMPRPAAYVIPGDQEAGENTSSTGLWQMMVKRVDVILDVDNTLDRRGQAAFVSLDAVQTAVNSAVLNWRPDWNPNLDITGNVNNRSARGFRFVSGDVVLMERARLHYRLTFEIEELLTDADGWQLTGPPLTEIQAQTNPNTMQASFDVELPQS